MYLRDKVSYQSYHYNCYRATTIVITLESRFLDLKKSDRKIRKRYKKTVNLQCVQNTISHLCVFVFVCSKPSLHSFKTDHELITKKRFYINSIT